MPIDNVSKEYLIRIQSWEAINGLRLMLDGSYSALFGNNTFWIKS